MKFSHSIQFNAVPDWSSNYISYSNLKKLIYQLEKQINQRRAATDKNPEAGLEEGEGSPLLGESQEWLDPDKVFSKKLDEELEKICSFYQLKEYEIYGEVDGLMQDVAEFEAEHAAGEGEGEGMGVRRQSLWARARQQSVFKNFQMGKRRLSSAMGTATSDRHTGVSELNDSDEEADGITESTGLVKSTHSLERRPIRPRNASISDPRSSNEMVGRRPSMIFNDFPDDALQALYDEGITLKKRIINLYVSICELKSFIQLNQTGFSKVLKKYDKTLDRNLKTTWINANVKGAYPFLPSTMDRINAHCTKVEEAYASIVTKGDVEAARSELRLHLREHVVWERNTVWREMIGIERKAQAANLGIRNTMLGQDQGLRSGDVGAHEMAATKELKTPVGRYQCPRFLLSGNFWVLTLCIIVFAVLLGVRFMEHEEQQNCLALVVFVSLLWATEESTLFIPTVTSTSFGLTGLR